LLIVSEQYTLIARTTDNKGASSWKTTPLAFKSTKSHETSLRPFLFIGIISATRSILSIGARLSVATGATTSADAIAKGTEFMHAMIELGVSAAVILALGITIKLLGNLVDDDSTKD
jgi:hypothetical protein